MEGGSRSSHEQHGFSHVWTAEETPYHQLPPGSTEWTPIYLRTIKEEPQISLALCSLPHVTQWEFSNLPVCLRRKLRPGEYKAHSDSSCASGLQARPVLSVQAFLI